ncbi:hypothetical protein [Neisseria gonorrhoeae]|nr:hypothetical protein [Neisseria gonorrhoeae]
MNKNRYGVAPPRLKGNGFKVAQAPGGSVAVLSVLPEPAALS